MATACLCSSIHQLANDFDEDKAKQLIPALNEHLMAIRSILAKSKLLSRSIQYHVTPNTQRTMKVRSISSIDTSRVNRVYERFKNNVTGFWESTDDSVHIELRRRLACILIFLRSRLDSEARSSPTLAAITQGQKYSELRYAGKKYIKIARKLGSIGSVLWLPLDIPSSTYERYVTMDDEDLFKHLNLVCSRVPDYSDFARHLLLSQLNDTLLNVSYLNLFTEYNDFLPAFDQLPLVLYALGGCEVPAKVLTGVRSPQRRWNENGEIESTAAVDFGFPAELVNILCDDNQLTQALARPGITMRALEDGTFCWSLCPELMSSISYALLPQTEGYLADTALRLICFACPPCFEGNTTWSSELKGLVWALLYKATDRKKIPLPLKSHVIEALLYLSERDSFSIRRLAAQRARTLLRKSMPYYIHASVTLFQSIGFRLDGDLAKSDSLIHDFLHQSQQPINTSRRDNALKGRLHISRIDNKIQRCDEDIASCIFDWRGELPLSALEVEVTRRLQSTTARFFQSIGDFQTAQASLEQYLCLNPAEPIRTNTRRLIVGRLVDIYCELREYEKAVEILDPEIRSIKESEKATRPARRALLALAELHIGQGRLDVAELVLQDVASVEPQGFEDVHEELLHMRRLLAASRISHEKLDYSVAVERWRSALTELEGLPTFRSRHVYVTAIIHLSISHALLLTGDVDGCKQSWAIAADILGREKCEYWIPIVSTGWVHKMVSAIHQSQGWPLRIMRPGRKPDYTWF